MANQTNDCFYLQQGNIYAVPILHYNMEIAAQVRLAFQEIQPTCVAVELAETMQDKLLHAASRLPDISLVVSFNKQQKHLYYLSEPCDGAFEGLRSALENQIPAYCIDLDVDYYPNHHDLVPDPYSIQRIGLKNYYEAYEKIVLSKGHVKSEIDVNRELYMARRLKELSLQHEKVLFIGGMYHVQAVLEATQRNTFPTHKHAEREMVEICTLSENSCRDVLSESGWFTTQYEDARSNPHETVFPPDRQKLIFQLYKEAANRYKERHQVDFPSYHLRNTMKFARNYALLKNRLMPDLYQLLSAAKGCVEHNYAYEVWELATTYPHLKNVDGLPELDLSVEEIWGQSKTIRFHLKEKGRKDLNFRHRKKDRSTFKFEPPGPFTICSYPPEDIAIENFGDFLQKKGTQLLREEGAKTAIFSSSLEDGLDMRETIRHWPEKKLYVKVQGKPPAGVGSIVVIFDEDKPIEGMPYDEKYAWKTTWLGEHAQESDMALYATPIGSNVVGPGISRSEYGGFMMSYPPRRMYDVWSDSDYFHCENKAEVLLMAAIDYAVKPVVVYVAATPPRAKLKQFARLYGKKVVYLPIGQLSPVVLRKMRNFHVLDSHERRRDAGEYIV